MIPRRNYSPVHTAAPSPLSQCASGGWLTDFTGPEPGEKLVVAVGTGDGRRNHSAPVMTQFLGHKTPDLVHRTLVERRLANNPPF